MNPTVENTKKQMQTHRKPSAQTIRRVGAFAALLAAFVIGCIASFSTLCVSIDTTQASETTTEEAILQDIESTGLRAFDVYVQYEGETFTYRTTGCKAGEAVYAVGLNADDDFALDPPAQTALTAGDTVRVMPCAVTERVVTEEIPYGTDLVKDDNLFVGQSRILSAGEAGEREIVYRDRYVGAKRVSTETVSVHVTKSPVRATQAIGTRKINIANRLPVSSLPLPEGFTLDENGMPATYQSYFDGIATAYYGGGITASGRPAAVGYVAVNPKVIPYGTKLWITSLDGEIVYGCAVAADTGGFVKTTNVDVDLYFNTYDECAQFGKRGVRIYIL